MQTLSTTGRWLRLSLLSLALWGVTLLQGCQFGFFPFPEQPDDASFPSWSRRAPSPTRTPSAPPSPASLYPDAASTHLTETLPLAVVRWSPARGELVLLNRSAQVVTLPTLHIHTREGKVTHPAGSLQGLHTLRLAVRGQASKDFLLIMAEKQGRFHPVRYLEYGAPSSVPLRQTLWQGEPLPAPQPHQQIQLAQADHRGLAHRASDYDVARPGNALQGILTRDKASPVAQATLQLRCDPTVPWGADGETQSDAQGRFRFALPPTNASVCWLRIEAPGTIPTIRTVLVPASARTELRLQALGAEGKRTARDTVTFANGVKLTAPADALDRMGPLRFTYVPAAARSHLDLNPLNFTEGYAVHGADPTQHLHFGKLVELQLPTPASWRAHLPQNETHVFFVTDAAEGTTSGMAYLTAKTLTLQVQHFSTQTIALGPVAFGAMRILIRSRRTTREQTINPSCLCSNRTQQESCTFQPYVMQSKLSNSISLEATRDLQQGMTAGLSAERTQELEAKIEALVAKGSGKASSSLSLERKLQELLKLQLTHGRETNTTQTCGGGSLPASPCLSLHRKATITQRRDTVIVQRYRSKISNLTIGLGTLVNPAIGANLYVLSYQSGEWVTLRAQEAYPVDEQCTAKDTATLDESCNCSRTDQKNVFYENGLKSLVSGPSISSTAPTQPACVGVTSGSSAAPYYVKASLTPQSVETCKANDPTLLQRIASATASLQATLQAQCKTSCQSAGYQQDRECVGTLGALGQRRIEVQCIIPYVGSNQLKVQAWAPCHCVPKAPKKKP